MNGKVYSKYLYYLCRRVLEIDRELNSVDTSYLMSKVFVLYKKIVNGNVNHVDSYTSDVRSYEELMLNYMAGKVFENLTLNSLIMSGKKRHDNVFVLNLEKFVTGMQLLLMNYDSHRSLFNKLGLREDDMNIVDEIYNTVINNFKLGDMYFISFDYNKRKVFIDMYWKVLSAVNKVNCLSKSSNPKKDCGLRVGEPVEIEYPEHAVRVSDLGLIIPKNVIVDGKRFNMNVLVPLEIVFTPRNSFKFRYTETGKSKLKELGKTFYLLIMTRPDYSSFEKSEGYSYGEFRRDFNFKYAVKTSDSIEKRIIEKKVKIGKKYFDVYNPDGFFIDFINEETKDNAYTYMYGNSIKAFINSSVDRLIKEFSHDGVG